MTSRNHRHLSIGSSDEELLLSAEVRFWRCITSSKKLNDFLNGSTIEFTQVALFTQMQLLCN